MSLDSLTLKCFLAVADTGNITRAADRVGRTQSAVSQQMAKLEGLLGKRLLDRGKPITLTQEGEVFLGYARRIYTLQREALDSMRTPELEGQLRFGLPEDFATVFLSDVLVDFARTHPRVMLNVECDFTLNLMDRFERGEFDLVLVKMSQSRDFPHGVEVWSEGLEWVGGEDSVHRVREGKALPLVLSPKPCVYRARALEALEKQGIKWRLVYTSPSYAGTVAAVKAGMGITVLPRTMIPDTLQIIPPLKLPELSRIHVSLMRRESQNPAGQSLEALVLERLKR